jgi:hypothetical protein
VERVNGENMTGKDNFNGQIECCRTKCVYR